MPRLLSNVPANKIQAKDDTSVDYYQRSLSLRLPNYKIEFILDEDYLRDDDWNHNYNSPVPILYKDTPFLWSVIRKNKGKTMPRLLSKRTTFGNLPSEVDYVKRILLEFGLCNEKENEIDRIITRVKVDIQQDKMNEEFEQNKVLKGPK